MPNRRTFLCVAVGGFLALSALAPGMAYAADNAAAFVKRTGDQLVAIVNGAGSQAEKRDRLTQVIDKAVDVDGIARFCLGRYWRQATPAQQQRYVKLFHQVLVTNITGKLGEYQGVTFVMGRSRPQDETEVVSTTVNRPNNPPTGVDWVIADPASKPLIIDVVAEGTSLRLTQRSDYASYLAHNGNNIDALIKAMQQQVGQGG